MNKKHIQRDDFGDPVYEPAIEDSKCFIKDKKPPVVTSHDERWKAPKGGRSAPDRPTAPDGVSGNWK